MTTLVHDRIVVGRPSAGSDIGLLARVKETLAVWARRLEEREALASFGWREMKDIAVSNAEIAREIGKPFWRA